jgi:SAM-dependent methyltransferase
MQIFDRKLKKLQRDKSAKYFHEVDYLFKGAAEMLLEIFTGEIISKKFDTCLEIGARDGYLSDRLWFNDIIQHSTICDMSEEFTKDLPIRKEFAIKNFDDEILPFPKESFDLIISNLNIHWINDLPGFLVQVKNILKPGGLFIASLFGGNTLNELSEIIYKIESDNGGISPRISPFADARDMAGLLQRARFLDPVSDSEVVNVKYKSAYHLMHEIKKMGEQNAVIKRSKKPIKKSVLAEINNQFEEKYSSISSFEIITISGWKV